MVERASTPQLSSIYLRYVAVSYRPIAQCLSVSRAITNMARTDLHHYLEDYSTLPTSACSAR